MIGKATFTQFFKLEAASGIILFLAALGALIFENSALHGAYHAFLHLPIGAAFGAIDFVRPFEFWINDGLMVIFFLLVGLEIKRELIEGHLSTPAKALIPAIAAVGGMIMPALVFMAFNYHNGEALRGWAIPTATDIAFALGVLALVGKNLPVSLRVFLTALAIIDDLGAVIIIALFYTETIYLNALIGAVAILAVLTVLNLRGVRSLPLYLVLGFVLWILVLQSGVHATVAGVTLAMTIPLRTVGGAPSPGKTLEHAIHPYVAFGIMPLFAFANAGLSLAGLTVSHLLDPIALGIALGLLVGKQAGVGLFSWLMIKFKFATLPAGTTWLQFYGVCIVTGIGFTMSLFVGSLAYRSADWIAETRLGVLSGSLLSALLGFVVLYFAGRRRTSSRG